MDKRKESADHSQTTGEKVTDMETSLTPPLGKRKSAFRRQNTTLDQTLVTTEISKHSGEIDKTVARDFGHAGIFSGEIVQVDYDSEDVDKREPIYVVEYTDGNREDMDSEEMKYAREFHLQRLGIDVGNETDASGSEDEDTYRPSPKVLIFKLPSSHGSSPNPNTRLSVEKESHKQCRDSRRHWIVFRQCLSQTKGTNEPSFTSITSN